MFDSAETIYQFIGERVLEALPVDWEKAELVIFRFEEDAFGFLQRYWNLDGDEHTFDVDEVDGEERDSEVDDAVEALFGLLQEHPGQEPFNKLRFTVTDDGDFQVEFKYAPDFAWFARLDPARDQLPGGDVINQIQSWDGVSGGVEGPWNSGDDPGDG